ncbi:MAG: ABC transporter permease [Burkholderiaceae bacterium]
MRDAQVVLELSGHWRLSRLTELSGALRFGDLGPLVSRSWHLDGSRVRSIDTAAALLMMRRLRAAGIDPEAVRLRGFSDSHRRILQVVLDRLGQTDVEQAPGRSAMLASLGRASERGWTRLTSHVSFFGITLAAIARTMRRPSLFRPRETFAQLQQTGTSAIPVVALVMFLIGAVMAYLLGLQAEQYGANIYVVDGVALGTVREFAPLLVATVVAGRSGAAFTAQLGTMKLTEEIDAIRTLGMSAEQVLLLPRVVAIVIALPLLVFVGNVFAMGGAALVCDLMLGITVETFVERLQSSLAVRHYLIGLLKAPVFAMVIAVIGCSMGLTVSRDTRAIGQHTTSTVVQCIVAVVLLDAVFAILFQELGW